MPQTPQTTQEPIHLFVEASFADVPEWIPLLPTPGIYPHPTYGDVDLSPEAIDRYVNNFNAGVYGQNKIPVDLEHDLPLSGAMGYMTEVRKNDNGSVDARVDWNERGRTVLAENRFGYVSPTLRESWTDPVSMQTHRNVTVGAALTTRPYFKEQSLRPLIAASEPMDAGTRQEGTRMSDNTDKTPVVDVQEFAELKAANAELIAKFNESETARAASETERVKLADEVKAMREEAQENKYRESLKGCTDVDGRIAELKALPVELHEGYVKRAQAERDARTAGLNFRERGVDTNGSGTSTLEVEVNKRVAEIRASDPKIGAHVARTRALEIVFAEKPELYRESRAN